MTQEQLFKIVTHAEEAVKRYAFAEGEGVARQAIEEAAKHIQPKNTEGVSTHSEKTYLQLYIRSLIILSESLWRRGLAEEAMTYARQVLQLAKASKLKMYKAKAYSYIGTCYYLLSDYNSAQKYYRDAIDIEEQLENKSGIAALSVNIGNTYRSLGDVPNALTYFEQGLRLYELLEDSIGISRVSHNMGIAYTMVKNSSLAMEHFQKGLIANRKAGNKVEIAGNLLSIGGLYRQESNYEGALQKYNEALLIYEEVNSYDGLASVHSGIGTACFFMGRYDMAVEHFNRSLSLAEKLGQKSHIALVSGNLGHVYATIAYAGYNPEKAVKYLRKSIAISEEINAIDQLKDSYLYLSTLYTNEKNWEESLNCYKRYHTFEKQVASEVAIREAQQLEHRRKIEEAERDRQVKLARFQEQEKILHNILPAQIAEQIVNGEEKIIQRYDNASVLFADVVGFTKLSEGLSLKEVAETLNRIFNLFDELATEFGVEKIKTIGDAYMCVSGLPEPCGDHAERMAKMALAMNYHLQLLFPDKSIKLRIGIHCGEVIAGVLGKNKFAYDLWGDTVNTASRMESHGVEDKIQVSNDFREHLGDRFNFEERGEIEVKGKGRMKTYFLKTFS